MRVITYLHFNGNCADALNFYKECLGGTILQSSKMGDSPMKVPPSHVNQIMHARLQIGPDLLYMSDTLEGGKTVVGNNIRLSLDAEDTKESVDMFNRLAAGGKVLMPLEKQFWGDKFGMLEDKFGIQWMMNIAAKK